MNEKDFATKLRPWLDRSAGEVGELQATRLRAARLKAMDAYREPVSILGVVTVGAGLAENIRYTLVQRALLVLPIIALVATLAFQSASTDTDDFGELDAQLLSQELPPDAFLDTDFRTWLGKTSG
ncbi:DUF3619 family protein [Usitatibacter palustris]|uniref:DUF3619 family protein n=1 Tax=Usitatibacter palustris TaxID=2732487 RepID=A0A6M4H4G9_9PROT|nr:DUF3619 family protein [Usitatibacter palustris]QJR14436.1 hypothetical protein DSM104440_01232 [Usitatibacter palustris]